MKTSSLVLATIFCAVLGIPSAPGAAVLTAVGVYDSPAKANAVDSTASGSSEEVAVFTPLVLSAFDADLGGVIDFDIAGTTTVNDTVFDLRYGVSAAKSLSLTTSVTIGIVPNVSPTMGTFSTISGNGALTNQIGGNGDIVFTLGPITEVAGGAAIPGEFVTSVGFTLLSRNNYPAGAGRIYLVTATFSDSSTAGFSTAISNARGGDDTFVSFTAPAGLSITTVSVDSDQTSGTNTPAFDDFAFRTSAIPEPASALLALVGGAGLLLRRRRR